MRVNKVSTIRTFTKGFVAPIMPAVLLLVMTTAAEAQKTQQHVQVQSESHEQVHHSDELPRVNVNGHNVKVPDNGTTTVEEGGTKTTLTHHEGDPDASQPEETSTHTESSGHSVNVSVTSDSSGNNRSRSHVDYHVNDSSSTTIHSNVDQTIRGEGSINDN